MGYPALREAFVIIMRCGLGVGVEGEPSIRCELHSHPQKMLLALSKMERVVLLGCLCEVGKSKSSGSENSKIWSGRPFGT